MSAFLTIIINDRLVMFEIIRKLIKFNFKITLLFLSFPALSQWEIENRLIYVLNETNNKNRQLPNYFHENNKKISTKLGLSFMI